jgi:hypothetical protein
MLTTKMHVMTQFEQTLKILSMKDQNFKHCMLAVSTVLLCMLLECTYSTQNAPLYWLKKNRHLKTE